VIVDGRRQGSARLRQWPARLRGGRRRGRDLSPDAVRDGRPGDGAEQRKPDRAADLLGGVEQAGGDTGNPGLPASRPPRPVTARFIRSFVCGGRVICRTVRDADSRPQSPSGHYPSSLPHLPFSSRTRTSESYLREHDC
jgi:hypothetical protein